MAEKIRHEFEVYIARATKSYNEQFGRDIIDFKSPDKRNYFSDKDETVARKQAMELADELIAGRPIAYESMKGLPNGTYDVVTVNHSTIDANTEDEVSFNVDITYYINI